MAVLHKEYYRGTGAGQEHIQENRDIRRYIQQTPDGDFSHILTDDDRWPVFYHLSQMRTSILNWYEWMPESELLEIGGEFGALTGMFCSRCGHVTTVEYGVYKAEAIAERYRDNENLDVYAGSVLDMEFDRQFDYIIMIGSLERQCGGSGSKEIYSNYLKSIKALLKPGGRLIIAVENRYGLRYFCGSPDPYTGVPFDGLNHHPKGSKGHTFDKHELETIMEAAGFLRWKFYYPLPDYKLAQMVYTDEYLPQKDLGERLLFYHVDQRSLVVPEQRLYSDIIDNQVFPFFANSFLVECINGSAALDGPVFAAVTTDRGKEHGFATSIHLHENKRIVKKRSLYKEGIPAVRQVYQNMMELKSRGVPIVPHELADDILTMPFIPAVTCSDYLRSIAGRGGAKFEQIFEQLYENILLSSDHVDFENNELPEAKQYTADYGVILKRCYVDMVPFNCFYIDNRLLFFDQEFVKENYPAKYPMYRALMYTYAFIPAANDLIPLEVMKERYGLQRLWDIFRREEDRFVSDNRRYDVYQNFYRWTSTDRTRMYDNALRLKSGQ